MTGHRPRLIVVADDLGMSPEVDAGIREAIRRGIVTTADLLVNPPFATDLEAFTRDVPCVSGSPENSKFSLGLHLNLCLGRPCCETGLVQSLVTDNGFFHASPAEAIIHLKPSEARKEILAQLATFEKLTGSLPAHLSFHKHLSTHDERILALLAEVAGTWRIPARAVNSAQASFLRDQKVLVNDHFLGDVRPSPYWTLGRLQEQLQSVPRKGIIELMCHPGYVMPAMKGVWYQAERMEELTTFTSTEAFALTRDFDLLPSSPQIFSVEATESTAPGKHRTPANKGTKAPGDETERP